MMPVRCEMRLTKSIDAGGTKWIEPCISSVLLTEKSDLASLPGEFRHVLLRLLQSTESPSPPNILHLVQFLLSRATVSHHETHHCTVDHARVGSTFHQR